MRLFSLGVVRVLAAVIVVVASGSAPSIPLGAAGHGHAKLDRLLRGKQAAPGRSRVVLRLASPDAVADVVSLANSYGGQVIGGLPIVDSVVLDLPNAALPMVAGDVRVAGISADRLVVGAMDRTGAAIGATAAWKVNLPIPLASGSTLSVSYAANLMTLLLLGPRIAVVVAAAGALAQCSINVKQRYPAYRTVFSVAAEILTMAATGLAYHALGGTQGPFVVGPLMKPLVGAIATYFCLNTGLVAIAIGLTTNRSAWRVWREEFLWSAASFMVAGSAGAIAAVVIHRGDQWKAVLLLAPVFLTYRTYQIFVGRIADERRHQARLAIALEETQAARAAAEAANAVKDQFLATVSHELRTPLNAILGWSDMLRSGIIPESRRVAASEAVYNNAQRQAHLIDELLDMARIMSGTLRLERALVEPRDIVSGAQETVQPAADAKRITIHTDLDPEIGPFYVDGARLQQVMWDLLSNAVKFTPEGGAVRRLGRSGERG